MEMSRREFIRTATITGGVVVFARGVVFRPLRASALTNGIAHPAPTFSSPLVIPPVMPRAGTRVLRNGKNADLYRHRGPAVQPGDSPGPYRPRSGATVVDNVPGTFNYPAFTIEAKWRHAGAGRVDQRSRRTRDGQLPASPAAGRPDAALGEPAGRQRRAATRGPTSSTTPGAVHGSGADRDPPARRSDRSATRATATPRPGTCRTPATSPPASPRDGHLATTSSATRRRTLGVRLGSRVRPRSSTRTTSGATTLWYHDHTLGMTRLNVYAGPAGFYLCAAGPATRLEGRRRPGRAARSGDRVRRRQLLRDPDRDPGPLVQRRRLAVLSRQPRVLRRVRGPVHPGQPTCRRSGTRSSSATRWSSTAGPGRGSGRAAALPLPPAERLQLAVPDPASSTNRRCAFWQIGAEGGFLPAPGQLVRSTSCMAPAERADVIVDFTGVPVGTEIVPDERGPGRAVQGRRARRRTSTSAPTRRRPDR